MRPGFTPENENGMCQLSGGDGGLTLLAEQDDKNCQETQSWGIQPIAHCPSQVKTDYGPGTTDERMMSIVLEL